MKCPYCKGHFSCALTAFLGRWVLSRARTRIASSEPLDVGFGEGVGYDARFVTKMNVIDHVELCMQTSWSEKSPSNACLSVDNLKIDGKVRWKNRMIYVCMRWEKVLYGQSSTYNGSNYDQKHICICCTESVKLPTAWNLKKICPFHEKC